jgi:hypothetical protein
VGDFVVKRTLARDVCVPFEMTRRADCDRNQLTIGVAAGKVDEQRWEC